MEKFIVLTAFQAKRVRRATGEGASLDPIALADGRFALPLAVLADPAHARHAAYLGRRPKRKLAPEDFLTRAGERGRVEAAVSAPDTGKK